MSQTATLQLRPVSAGEIMSWSLQSWQPMSPVCAGVRGAYFKFKQGKLDCYSSLEQCVSSLCVFVFFQSVTYSLESHFSSSALFLVTSSNIVFFYR